MHLSVRFSTEKELKQFQDLLYEKSGQGVSFTGLLEAMVSEVTIVTAVHIVIVPLHKNIPGHITYRPGIYVFFMNFLILPRSDSHRMEV